MRLYLGAQSGIHPYYTLNPAAMGPRGYLRKCSRRRWEAPWEAPGMSGDHPNRTHRRTAAAAAVVAAEKNSRRVLVSNWISDRVHCCR